jgi:hypothetical protein
MNVVLRLEPTDAAAWKMKLGLLGQMDEFGKAADMLANPVDSDEARGLAYAYTMYKLGRYDETRDAVASAPDSRGFMHLKAQLVSSFIYFWVDSENSSSGVL